MSDQAVIEIQHLRREVAALVEHISPWIGMDEMMARYGVTGKTLLAMERRGEIPQRVRGRWRRDDVLKSERR